MRYLVLNKALYINPSEDLIKKATYKDIFETLDYCTELIIKNKFNELNEDLIDVVSEKDVLRAKIVNTIGINSINAFEYNLYKVILGELTLEELLNTYSVEKRLVERLIEISELLILKEKIWEISEQIEKDLKKMPLDKLKGIDVYSLLLSKIQN